MWGLGWMEIGGQDDRRMEWGRKTTASTWDEGIGCLGWVDGSLFIHHHPLAHIAHPSIPLSILVLVCFPSCCQSRWDVSAHELGVNSPPSHPGGGGLILTANTVYPWYLHAGFSLNSNTIILIVITNMNSLSIPPPPG